MNQRRLSAAGMMSSVPDLQELAKKHLWLHFARLGLYQPESGGRDVPTFVRGENQYLFDTEGKRYLDALAGLFTVQVGHGRADIAAAAARQAEQLAYYP